MIDFLTCQSWIGPQIDFLVMLQNFRTQHSDIYTKIFLNVTMLGELWLPILIGLIYYWCFNSKKGMYLCSLLGFNFLVGQFTKLVASIYRPWIISSKVIPVEEAMLHSGGYSFPSGHTTMASSLFGGIAFLVRRKIFICLALIFLILIVGFSRLWLGVHTPQDVLVGLIQGLFIVLVSFFMINWAEKNPKTRYPVLLSIINILAIAALIYICYFNKYPMDYVDGKLLANPQKAIHTSFVCYGFSIGLINGGFLCRAFFPFEAQEAPIKKRILRGIIGAMLIVVMLTYPLEYCFSPACNCKMAFMLPMLFGFILTAGYPYLFTRCGIFK